MTGDWYKAKMEDAPEMPPLQSGCKNLVEVIVDSFWTAEQIMDAAIICAQNGLVEDAKELLSEAKKWRDIGASLIE